MPRKRKTDIEKLLDTLEDSEFTTRDLQEINRVVARKMRNREVFRDSNIRIPGEDRAKAHKEEAKYVSSKEPKAAAVHGGGSGKSSSGKKD